MKLGLDKELKIKLLEMRNALAGNLRNDDFSNGGGGTAECSHCDGICKVTCSTACASSCVHNCETAALAEK
ncbi:MAG: hypothetical protein GY765_13075 [bacterium]|nr:hypothetical protein [bacterium]